MMGEWIVSASVLILVVLALRGALGKRISAGMRYGMWAVVLVRLLVPVSLLAVTVPELPVWTPPESMREQNIYVLPVDRAPVEESGVYVAEDGTLAEVNSFGYSRLENDGRTVVRYADKISMLELGKWVWISGGVLLGGVLLASNLRFWLRLRRARRRLEGTGGPIPVYAAAGLPSPCLVGLLRPAVYVTEEAAVNPVMLRHVLAHEMTHYRHLDHLWSVLRGAALAIHWWNPLVWLAVVLSRRDGELACDEGALKQLGDGERTAYGETLLTLVTAKARPQDLLSFATTMTGGKRSLRERIQRIARRPRQLAGAVVVTALVLTLTVLVTFGQARGRDEPLAGGTSFAGAADAWRDAEITLDEKGVPHIRYGSGDAAESFDGEPIPAPRSWKNDDLAGRNQATALQYSTDVWAKLVSETEGWLVACYGRGVAAADTYVYRTEDGGRHWTEVTMPGTSWHIADVGFLSPDRLIVAQRLFEGAPCFLTKDGGESWELVNMPWVGAEVESIYAAGDSVQMILQEDGTSAWVMTSDDLGDTWTSWNNAALDHFLSKITAEDIGDTGTDAGELARLLRETSAHRWSRFLKAADFARTESWMWCEAELTVPLTEGGSLYLAASYRNQTDLIIGRQMDEGIQYACYSSQELHELVCRLGEPYPTEVLSPTPDLNHDGKPDQLRLRRDPLSGSALCLQIIAETDTGRVTWEEDASSAHAGWCGIFLVQIGGEDYLLRYTPWMGGGACSYGYRLFYVGADSMPVVVQGNAVEFDLIFAPEYAQQHQYDPWAINAFMEEINALLAGSTPVLITDENLKSTFDREGRLYDSVWWLDDDRDENLSLLDNLLNYGNYAQDHPDDVWSPLGDLLMNLTEEDIPMFDGDTTKLVGLLRSAERGSRFYPWDSEREAYLGHGAEEVHYTTWNLSLADGNTLWLLASEDRPNVLMIYETPEGATSAFYTAPALKEWIISGDFTKN